MRVRDGKGGLWLAGLLLAAAAVLVLWPAGFAAWEIAAGLARGGGVVKWPAAILIWRTVWVCGLIAALATLIAAPCGWVSRRLPGRWSLLMVAPMLMPSYLAYAGWGLLRAPGTWLGDWLLRGPGMKTPITEAVIGGTVVGTGGGNWWPVAASQVQAVMGLVLWSWPIAAVVIGATARRVDEAVLESMRVDGAGRWARAWEVARMLRGGLVAAAGAVMLVMIGSAVPLHVAQFDTLAIGIWRTLDEVSVDRHWTVWVWGWPLVVIAVAAGAWLARRADGDGGEEGLGARESVGALWSGAGLLAMLVWILAVVVPMGLLLAEMRGVRALVNFVRIGAGSIRVSVEVAAAVGVIGAGLIAAAWMARSAVGRMRHMAALVMGVSLVAGLVPGVLVGSALAHTFNSPGLRWVGESSGIVVVAHVARFGFVALGAGMLMARWEGRACREMRVMEGGDSALGWWLGAGRARAGQIAAVVLAVGLLSFHEIEATVMVQPASSVGGGFSWRLLQALHFNREEDLIPAMVLVMGAGLAVMAAVVGLGAGWRDQPRAGSAAKTSE